VASPIAAEAVVRIAELFAIERDIKGAPPNVQKMGSPSPGCSQARRPEDLA
jgi:hypothetical protein